LIAEIKTIPRRVAVGQVQVKLQKLIHQRYAGYLIAGFATPHMAEECRKLDLSFLLYRRQSLIFTLNLSD
jgi:hypothetical protein